MKERERERVDGSFLKFEPRKRGKGIALEMKGWKLEYSLVFVDAWRR